MFWSLHYPTWTGISSSLGFPVGSPHWIPMEVSTIGGPLRGDGGTTINLDMVEIVPPPICVRKKNPRESGHLTYIDSSRFLTHRILLSVWRVQGQIWPWRILGSESQLRCMGNWCVWNDNPSFSGNSSSISKHTSLVNTQFGSFAHKSHFIFPISPWSLDFPQKQGVIFFSLARLQYPSVKLTVSQEWVSFLPLTLEGFRVSCLPFGDFKPSLSGAKSCSFREKIPTFPV